MKEAVLLRQGYIANLASVEVIDERLRSFRRSATRRADRVASTGSTRGIELRDVSFEYTAEIEGVD